MGTIRDDFHYFGSLPLAIDMLNNLVMAGAVLWEVDFNILADMPSGLFDLETSSDPNINNTFSSVRVGMMDILIIWEVVLNCVHLCMETYSYTSSAKANVSFEF